MGLQSLDPRFKSGCRLHLKTNHHFICREMAERLNAAVLKTVEGNTSGGSNPSLPASLLKHPIKPTLYQLRKEIFTTSLQLLRNFLYSNTTHLQKFGNTHYFVVNINTTMCFIFIDIAMDTFMQEVSIMKYILFLL